MKVYTVQGGSVRPGARLVLNSNDDPDEKFSLHLGGGINGRRVPVFRNNLPVIVRDSNSTGIIMDAQPVQFAKGYALAKPDHPSDRILVVVKTRNERVHRRTIGTWWFDPHTTTDARARYQSIVMATGPVDFRADQDEVKNIGWFDALVVMEVGDGLRVTDQRGLLAVVRYESVDRGLVQLHARPAV